MEGKDLSPVEYAGKLKLTEGLVDVGSLESTKRTLGFVQGLKVKPGVYACYVGRDGNGRNGALIIVSESFEGESLEATESFGEAPVGLTGMVGFFRAPKKEYTANQLDAYIKELMADSRKGQTVINSKQFMAASGMSPAVKAPIFVHRDVNGEVDAVQIEFRQALNEIMAKAVEVA